VESLESTSLERRFLGEGSLKSELLGMGSLEVLGPGIGFFLRGSLRG